MLLPLRSGTQVYIDVVITSSDAQGESWSTTIEAADLLEHVQGFEPKLLHIIRNIDGPIGVNPNIMRFLRRLDDSEN